MGVITSVTLATVQDAAFVLSNDKTFWRTRNVLVQTRTFIHLDSTVSRLRESSAACSAHLANGLPISTESYIASLHHQSVTSAKRGRGRGSNRKVRGAVFDWGGAQP